MALRSICRGLRRSNFLLPLGNSCSHLHSHATSFGFKEISEDEKSRMVGNVFTSVASNYDLMNDLMSGGLHRLWKDRIVSKLSPFPGMKHLDVAGGTGDVAFRILESINNVGHRALRDMQDDPVLEETQIFVCDINPNMLNVGKKRAQERGLGEDKSLIWVEGDAEVLKFANDSMDGYTIAFGIRNVTHIEKVLAEAYRVLKRGGRFLCLELSHVELPIFKDLYDYYSFSVIPAVGNIVTGDRESYQYLVESIRRFPPQINYSARCKLHFMFNGSRIVDLLKQCTNKQLKQIHAFIITSSLDQIADIRLKLLRRSTEFGQMEYPNLIFQQFGGMYNTDVTLWNAMIRGFDYNGPPEDVVELFDEMSLRGLTPNNFTYPYVLNSCSQLGLFRVGQKVHCRAIKSGFETAFSVGNALFNFYEDVNDCRRIFYGIGMKTLELWNRMVGKYVSKGNLKSARQVFDEMSERDIVSWNTILSGYAKTGDLTTVGDLFERMPEKNVVSWTTMVGAYAASGQVGTARKIFEQMPDKNVVSWNCMMSSYTQIGEFQQTLDLFVQMRLHGVEPDSYTFVAALSACSGSSDLKTGKWIHSLITDWHMMGTVVWTALLQMYATCGDIDTGFSVFIKIGDKDVFSYNVMIKSLALHGRAQDAVKIFHQMIKRGLKPNNHSYLSVLFACNHGGLVEEGCEIFKDMRKYLEISPEVEHYCSMIDLLCRNDQIEEAEILIKEMQEEPDIAIWGALLGGCRASGNLKLAEDVMSKAVGLKSEGSGVHVLLSNICASMGQWSDALKARTLMEDRGISKTTGISSIIR